MTAGVGHNSGDASAHPDVLNGDAQSQLKSILERIETLDDEKDAISEHIKEVYAEAKGNGFSLAPIRKLVALRKKDRSKVLEEKAILELYAHALGIEDLV
jgi:uncharacterized protein (UPF0335 family)